MKKYFISFEEVLILAENEADAIEKAQKAIAEEPVISDISCYDENDKMVK